MNRNRSRKVWGEQKYFFFSPLSKIASPSSQPSWQYELRACRPAGTNPYPKHGIIFVFVRNRISNRSERAFSSNTQHREPRTLLARNSFMVAFRFREGHRKTRADSAAPSGVGDGYRNSISPLTTTQSSRDSSPQLPADAYEQDSATETGEESRQSSPSAASTRSCASTVSSSSMGLLGPKARAPAIARLPSEILLLVVDALPTVDDVKAFMLVQKSWMPLAQMRLWYKVMPTSRSAYYYLLNTLRPRRPSDVAIPSELSELDEGCETEIAGQDTRPNSARELGTLDRDEPEQLARSLRMLQALRSPPAPSDRYRGHIHRINLTHVADFVIPPDLFSFLNCASVERLVLTNCRGLLEKELCVVLAGMPNLVSLDVQRTSGVGDDFLATLASRCTKLEVLYFCANVFTDQGVRALHALTSTLRRLKFSSLLAVNVQTIVDLATACRRLVELDVSLLECVPPGELTDEMVRAVLGHCRMLRELRVDGPTHISATAFARTSSPVTVHALPSLRMLSLAMCERVDDAAIAAIVVTAPRIRHLNLNKCPRITDASLHQIAAAYNSTLYYLHVGHCVRISDEGVRSIRQRCLGLSFFDAANCTKLTSASLISLASLPRLRRIGVVKCTSIGDEGIIALATAQRRPPFERLHFSYCTQISVSAIKRLVNSCPRLVHLSLTGVQEFMNSRLRLLSRKPSDELTEHQKQLFCVFSGTGISRLRSQLNSPEPTDQLPTLGLDAHAVRDRRLPLMLAWADPAFDDGDPEEQNLVERDFEEIVPIEHSGIDLADALASLTTLEEGTGPVSRAARSAHLAQFVTEHDELLADTITSMIEELAHVSLEYVPYYFLNDEHTLGGDTDSAD